MSKLNASYDFNRLPVNEVPRFVSIFCQQVFQTINGNLDFSNNFDGKIITCVFTLANTETSFLTGLDRIASNYISLNKTVAMDIYNGSSANSVGTIYLKSSAIGTASILVF